MASESNVRQRLRDLQEEHRKLDKIASRLSRDPLADQLQLRRLKKRKLLLKDAITRLESQIIPNILA